MDSDELRDALIGQLRPYFLPLILGISGVFLLFYGLFTVSQAQSTPDVVFEPAGEEVQAQSDGKKEITVDIEGAVAKPGVYTLASNTRMQDALLKAGGLLDKADREQIAKQINLAAPLTDGAKIYFPFLGEQVVLGAGTTGEGSGVTNINTASQKTLEALPGIGPVTAEKIITNRPYETIQDLLAKKAISSSVFEKIKDSIAVY